MHIQLLPYLDKRNVLSGSGGQAGGVRLFSWRKKSALAASWLEAGDSAGAGFFVESRRDISICVAIGCGKELFAAFERGHKCHFGFSAR